MGISFKVSKIGRRVRPKPPPSPSSAAPSLQESDKDPNGTSLPLTRIPPKPQVHVSQTEAGDFGLSVSSASSGKHASSEHETSFALNLFPDGFSIVKPSEMIKLQAPLQDVSKSLHQYNRMSQTLFSAIELGQLPADILDGIPSKYIDGNILCEVRDYRNYTAQETNGSSAEGNPIISKVILRMSLENIVKDIPTISDDSWTYSDLMEVESRVLKALQPQLCLDPTPMLDRLCSDTRTNKLNLAISSGKRKRLPQEQFTNATNNRSLAKKNCVGKTTEKVSCGSGDLRAISGEAHQNITMQHNSCAVPDPRLMQDGSLPTLPPASQPSIAYMGINQDQFPVGANKFPVINAQVPLSQNIMSSYPDKRKDNKDMQQISMSTIQRPNQAPVGQEDNQHLSGLQVEGTTRSDMRWKNAQLSQQMDGKGVRYSTIISGQKYSSPVANDVSNLEAGNPIYLDQKDFNIGIKQEHNEIEKLDRQESDKFKNVLQMPETERNSLNHQQLRTQQLVQQPLMKSQISTHQQWHSITSPVDKDTSRDDLPLERRVQQSHCVSATTSIQSPISTKSGELSTGSLNGQFGVVAQASFGSQKEKPSTISNAVLGTASATSSLSDTIQKQSQKRKASSMTKSHVMSGVASPASVGSISTPLNTTSPSVIGSSMVDPAVLDRFSKIDMISQRYQFNVKKNKVETFNISKPTHSKEEIACCLSVLNVAEDFKDPIRPMSRSIIGGTMNNCKRRILAYVPRNTSQGITDGMVSRNHYRLIMNENPVDGKVIMQYDDVEGSDIHLQDCMIVLPSTHYADLLAAQHNLLMMRDGYKVIDDLDDQTIARTNVGSGNQPSVPGMPLDASVPEANQPETLGQQSNVVSVNSNNNEMNHPSSTQDLPNNMRMLPPGNTHALPISEGYLPGGPTAAMSTRSQQMEQALLQQHQNQQQMHHHQMQPQLRGQSQQIQLQQQLQQAQIQRASSMLQTNPLSQIMGQNPSIQRGGNPMINKTQLQIQALRQQQFPRKGMMGGLGGMGMGNSMMGLSALNNVVGGACGISSPLAQMQGLNNIGASQMNFGVGVRPGSPQAAALAKYKMQQSQMYGTQPGISSLQGNSNQMLSSSMGMSMLGRSNMSSLPRTAVASMGPPKIPGTNVYMNQQQQLQLQQQKPLQQQQQVCSPLQQSQVSSPSMIGSPQAVAMQQQQISPQQLNQQIATSPQQLSGGTLQQMNGGTAGPGPASPQLSSQTHNSVGSISSSPMELQGVNKTGSVNNTG